MPKAMPQEAIVVLGGSFCPPHAGHIAALNQGRAIAESDSRLTVVAGYFAVAPNGHVRGKLRGRGEEASFAFDAQDRVRMCNAAAETTGWIKPSTVPFGSAQACGAAMVAQNHTPHTLVVAVRGRDAELLTTADGEVVSSTLVRRELRGGGMRAVGRLLKNETLLPPVAQMMEQLLTSAPPPSDAAASSHEPPPVTNESGCGSTRELASTSVVAPASDAVVVPPPGKRQQSWGATTPSRPSYAHLHVEMEGRLHEHDMAALAESAHAGADVVEAGFHVFRAEWDAEGVYFYQAFSDEIAEWAIREQRFGGPKFNASRMTWIKPSFAWVLYRSGYGRKHNQQRVLKIKLAHPRVAALLTACACKHGGGGSKGRVQWDPARDLMTSEANGREPRRMLRERAIQIGLSRDLSEAYVAGVLSIEDVTPLARQVGVAHGNKDERQVKAAMTALLPQLPAERPYMPSCPGEELVRLTRAGQGCLVFDTALACGRERCMEQRVRGQGPQVCLHTGATRGPLHFPGPPYRDCCCC